jgi:hypothetical protein
LKIGDGSEFSKKSEKKEPSLILIFTSIPDHFRSYVLQASRTAHLHRVDEL